MGIASDDFMRRLLSDKHQWLTKCPIRVVSLETGPRAALVECDKTVRMIGSRYASPEMDYENQKKLLGLCETLYCHFRACIDHNRLPAANQVVVVKNLRPQEDHYAVFAMFYRKQSQ